MARQLLPFVRPLYRYQDAFSATFAAGNRYASNRALIEFWQLVDPLCGAIDALKPLGQYGQDSRGLEIPRSLLLKLALGIRFLGLGPIIGLRHIQTSLELRDALDLELPDGTTIDALRRAQGGQDVIEACFPTRQVLSDFVNRWLAKYGGLELLDDYAHLLQPYEIGVLYGADYSVVVIDSKMAPSARRYTETDLMGIGRRNHPIKRGTPGRLAHGVAACKDIPALLGGDLVPISEPVWAVEYGIPAVARRAWIMRRWMDRDGIDENWFIPACEATWVGDGLYWQNPVVQACMHAGHRSAFRLHGSPHREVVAEYLASPPGNRELKVLIEITDGGVCYCPCDRYDLLSDEERPITERTPMAQHQGPSGFSGYALHFCETPGCPKSHNAKLKVPYDAVRGSEGKPDYRVVTAMPRADKRTEAINFKGQQTIEQRNRALASLGIALQKPDQSFVLTGGMNNRVQLLLTHIVLNARILLNAERLERAEYPWLQAFNMSMRKSKQIYDRKPQTDENGNEKKPWPKITNMYYPLPQERPDRRIDDPDQGAITVTKLRPDLPNDNLDLVDLPDTELLADAS